MVHPNSLANLTVGDHDLGKRSPKRDLHRAIRDRFVGRTSKIMIQLPTMTRPDGTPVSLDPSHWTLDVNGRPQEIMHPARLGLATEEPTDVATRRSADADANVATGDRTSPSESPEPANLDVQPQPKPGRSRPRSSSPFPATAYETIDGRNVLVPWRTNRERG